MRFFKTATPIIIGLILIQLGQTNLYSQSNPELITLEGYINQVKRSHLGIQSAKISQEATLLRNKEKDLLTTPTFFASTQLISDQKQSLQYYITKDNSLYEISTIGISIPSDSGWEAKAFYDLRYSSYPDGNTSFLSSKAFYEASPVLEISKSLMRNSEGEEIKASKAISESNLLSQDSLNSYKTKHTISMAEQAYWQLAFAIAAIKLHEESVQHAVEIKDWTLKREALYLTDHSDALQAMASLKLRQLELLYAMNDKRIAIRNFNNYRGIESDQLSESLVKIEDCPVDGINNLPKKTYKDDLTALTFSQNVLNMNMILAKEKLKPNLTVFGSLALNNRQEDLGNTALNTFSLAHPTTMIGIKYSIFLDTSSLDDIKKGLDLEIQSSQLLYDQKKEDQKRDCLILVQKLEEAQKKFDLALSIESSQKEKWLYEVKRHTKGRTTTNQVINFEQDYLNSQLTKLKILSEIWQLSSQLKEFSL